MSIDTLRGVRYVPSCATRPATRDGVLGEMGVAAVFGLIIMVMIYATGRLCAAHQSRAAGRVMADLLFVCLHNAGRSQLSQALFERAAAGTGQEAASAGTTPADRVHPEVVEAMRELGIDIADRTPQRLTDKLAGWADVVVTMGCGDACPYIRGTRYIDWELPDPTGRPLDEVCATRDDIARRVQALVEEL